MDRLNKGYIVAIIILILSMSIYITTVNIQGKDTEHFTKQSSEVKGEKVEKVGNFTKDHISDNKIYFTENLPTYIPGRTTNNSVDTTVFKTSKFKEAKKFTLIRVYSKDDDGNRVHIYRFVPKGEKVK
ncbi:membrane protein [Staphylococcus phage vB_SepM_ phiIPLA-C1C]|jgi:hypothetical protein|uniref:Membrane protein n=4 Tax=Sepunavirus TaxID=1980928 RepID=A0A0D3MVK6_9CAUD|nr:membrane protein [Staphylococcus phage phiIPLA-C1C]QLF86894.1 hypothetical protein BESEP4_00160 [Staphylococcus phage vB_SepM_BE04]QLF87077.1 hypothetical protein BESEP5_00135 [Staphylococcus phage vB_SepM_BE05]QLF87288.1 hypothetical protein BESEP6_00134 [Staphylococcus phage vB_SepM_BE06]QLF87415.1 hypothetical protein BESEP7_00067 [Staphylococcus phage vB_SepM_BE07]QLF87699.1 hypothetical protein BESEP8_00151 [Staphylococcus phage vB_SepM_BE08]QLF87889.1 hypothetical protein BESEP9_0014